MAYITVMSIITGIHRTKVGSHRDVRLLVEDDDTIPGMDPNCMIVRIPPLEEIPPNRHGRDTNAFCFILAFQLVRDPCLVCILQLNKVFQRSEQTRRRTSTGVPVCTSTRRRN